MYSQTTCTIQQIAFSKGALTALSDFDAWGIRRNSDWTIANVPTSFIFDRGFTGHEHPDEFGLINMLSETKSRNEVAAGNGRVYDDAVGRFLSPDPFVQMPDNAQNFNRYLLKSGTHLFPYSLGRACIKWVDLSIFK